MEAGSEIKFPHYYLKSPRFWGYLVVGTFPWPHRECTPKRVGLTPYIWLSKEGNVN